MNDDGDLTCRELVELVTEYLEGALPPPAQQRFEQHLDFCEGCRTHLDQCRQTIVLTGRLHEEQLDPVTRQTLLDAFRQWKQASPSE